MPRKPKGYKMPGSKGARPRKGRASRHYRMTVGGRAGSRKDLTRRAKFKMRRNKTTRRTSKRGWG